MLSLVRTLPILFFIASCQTTSIHNSEPVSLELWLFDLLSSPHSLEAYERVPALTVHRAVYFGREDEKATLDLTKEQRILFSTGYGDSYLAPTRVVLRLPGWAFQNLLLVKGQRYTLKNVVVVGRPLRVDERSTLEKRILNGAKLPLVHRAWELQVNTDTFAAVPE